MDTTASGRRRDEGGASAVEYALMVSLIAAVIIVSVIAFGIGVNGLFDGTCTKFNEAAAGITC